MDKFGKLIKEQREAKGESREELAKALGCKESFVRHIECSAIVPVSERILKGLKKHFRSIASDIDKTAKRRNSVGRKWFKEYRERTAV